MSADADRIRKLRERLTHYLLHGVGDVSAEAVEGNLLAEESRTVIDQLTVELAEARTAACNAQLWRREIDELQAKADAVDAELDAKHARLVEVADKLRAEREQHEHTKAELAARDARIAELTAALDRDQTGLANALAAIKQRVGAGWWITEGRGSYAWDDDRYRRETTIVLGDVAALASKALHASGDIANQALIDTPLAVWDAARELRKRLADAIAREQAAQAEAAALRLAVEDEVIGDGWPEDFPGCVRALMGDAGRFIATRVTLLEAVASFIETWSQWALNGYVATDLTTRENLRALRRWLGLDQVDGVESWEVERLYGEMITAREKLDGLDEKGGTE